METTIKVFSGIKPSGKLHLGNYLGALKQWIELQNDYAKQCLYCIVDLHAITVPYEPKVLRQRTEEMAIDFLSLGLDPKKATLFVQSHVPEHTEFMWLLNTVLPVSELERMTQYKDKSKKHAKSIHAGLLNYPILMASDILLYRASFVPVGEDQLQHVELTRLLARKMNNTFGLDLPEPEAIVSDGARIRSLTDSSKKMEKTDSEKSFLALADEPDVVREKIGKAVADEQGLHNLLLIGNALVPESEAELRKLIKEKNNKAMKEVLAELIIDAFADYRKKRQELEKKPDRIHRILDEGANRARPIAQEALADVKAKMGLA